MKSGKEFERCINIFPCRDRYRHFPYLKVSPTKGNELYETPAEHKRMAPESQKVDLCYHCDIQNTIIIQCSYTFRYFYFIVLVGKTSKNLRLIHVPQVSHLLVTTQLKIIHFDCLHRRGASLFGTCNPHRYSWGNVVTTYLNWNFFQRPITTANA